MATYVPAKVSTQYVFYASLVSQANTKLMQVNPTIASGDFKVSIDGGALANLATLPTVTPAGGSMVKFTLSTSEMAGANATVVCLDAAGAEWCDLTINVPTAARQVDDLAYPATSGRSLVVDASGLADANTVKLGPTGAGTAQTARDLGTSVLLSTGTGAGQLDFTAGVVKANLVQILGTALTETAGLLAGGFKKFFNIATPAATMDHGVLVDTVTTYTGNTPQTGDVYPKVDTEVATLVTGVADVQSRIPAALTAGGNIKAGVQGFLDTVFTEGAAGRIAAAFKQFFNIATPAATMDHGVLVDTATIATTATNLTNAPTSGDFTATMKTSIGTAVAASAVASVTAGVDIIKILGTAISTPATPGILDTNVKNINNLAATPITTIKAVQGLAVDGVIPAATNLTNAPTAGDLTATMKTSVTGAVQAALDGTIADAIPADGTRPSISSALYLLTQFMLERSVSSTTCTVKKPDGSTTLFTLTLDSATAPTSITRAT